MMKKRQKLKQYDASYKKLGGKYSDSDGEETELFTKTKPPRRETPTIEKDVEEGDTLQSLSLRYNCTIEELKRLNNIHKDNEIFAKRTIKVPHHPLSMALAGVHSGTSSPNAPGPVDTVTLKTELNSTLVNLTKEAEVNEIIFNTKIASPKPSESLVADFEDVEDQEVRLLPQTFEPVVTTSTRLDCSGVDGDISLKALILFIVVLIFAVPLIYVFYIAEHPEQYHLHHSNLSNHL